MSNMSMYVCVCMHVTFDLLRSFDGQHADTSCVSSFFVFQASWHLYNLLHCLSIQERILIYILGQNMIYISYIIPSSHPLRHTFKHSCRSFQNLYCLYKKNIWSPSHLFFLSCFLRAYSFSLLFCMPQKAFKFFPPRERQKCGDIYHF